MKGFTVPAEFVKLSSPDDLYDGQEIYVVEEAAVSFGQVEKKRPLYLDSYWVFTRKDGQDSFALDFDGGYEFYGKPKPWLDKLEDGATYVISPKTDKSARLIAIWQEYENVFMSPGWLPFSTEEIWTCRPVGEDLLPPP